MLVEVIMCVLMIFVLGHLETRSSTTKWVIPNSFPAYVTPLPANNLRNGPPWPLAPFPNAADLEAKEFALRPK